MSLVAFDQGRVVLVVEYRAAVIVGGGPDP